MFDEALLGGNSDVACNGFPKLLNVADLRGVLDLGRELQDRRRDCCCLSANSTIDEMVKLLDERICFLERAGDRTGVVFVTCERARKRGRRVCVFVLEDTFFEFKGLWFAAFISHVCPGSFARALR